MRRRRVGGGSLRSVLAAGSRYGLELLGRLGSVSPSARDAVEAEVARIEAGGPVEFSGWQARGFGLAEHGRYRLEADDSVTDLGERPPEVTDLRVRRREQGGA